MWHVLDNFMSPPLESAPSKNDIKTEWHVKTLRLSSRETSQFGNCKHFSFTRDSMAMLTGRCFLVQVLSKDLPSSIDRELIKLSSRGFLCFSVLRHPIEINKALSSTKFLNIINVTDLRFFFASFSVYCPR